MYNPKISMIMHTYIHVFGLSILENASSFECAVCVTPYDMSIPKISHLS